MVIAATGISKPEPGEVLARQVVDRAMDRYFEARRARVVGFVARHFSARGSLRLHRHALGWDFVRAPVNIFLVVPTVALKLAAAGVRLMGARRLARWLATRNLFLETAVAREVRRLLIVEFLELPFARPGWTSTPDALTQEILADSRIEALPEPARRAVSASSERADLRTSLAETLATYVGTRAATADIAVAAATVGLGAAAFNELSTGALSLGPALAHAAAGAVAIASFPFGETLGRLWYWLFPLDVPPVLTIAATAAVMAVSSILAAFAGLITDPLQRRLGLHRRRLERMLDVLERQFRGDAEGYFVVRDHYVGRLLDLFEVVRATYRAVP